MSFFAELKRRNVFRVAVAYAIVAWLLTQVIVAVKTPLHLPGWADTFIILLLAIGFPVALILAWAFELTPEGIKPTESVTPGDSITKMTGRKLDFIIIGVLAIAVGFLLVDNYVLQGREEETIKPDKSVVTGPATASVTTSEKKLSAVSTTPSLAVLPFADMSPNKDQEYFSDGLAEELLNKLARLDGLLVAGRTSSFAFKGKNEDLRVIGETLDVKYILEGSVRKSADTLRITAQLINAADGYHVWSQTYDRAPADIFAIQDEIAEAVAAALSITLGVGELGQMDGGTSNLEAYDEYLQGRKLGFLATPDGARGAVEHLNRSVEIDPGFARAWAELANAYNNLDFSGADRNASDNAAMQHALEQARRLAPDLPLITSGLVILYVNAGDYQAAEQLIQKAMEKSGASDVEMITIQAQFLRYVGRATEAIPYFERARRLDPLRTSSLSVNGLFMTYGSLGHFDKAIEEINRLISLPNAPDYMYHAAALGESMAARDRTAMDVWLGRVINRGLRDDPTTLIMDLRDTPDAALAKLHEIYKDPAYNTTINRAVISQWAAYFQDYDFALDVLSHMSADNSTLLFQIWRSNYRQVWKLPGFKDFVEKLGLVDYWRKSGDWGDFCRPVGDNDFACG